MKKIWMLMVIFCTVEYVHGQNEKKHYFGVRYSYGACFFKDGMFSEKQLDGKTYHSAGFDYSYRFWENTELGLGLMWAVNLLDDRRHIFNPNGNPNIETTTSVNALSIPVYVKHSQKYFFIGGGPCLNYHPWFDNWTWGIGFELNVGLQYVFKSGLTVFVSPRGQINMLNLSGNENIKGIKKDVLSQLGISIGLGYKFGK